MQVSAEVYGQRITLVQERATLESALEKISKQSGLDFVVSTKMLQNANVFDLKLVNATVKQALEQCFANQPLTYSIVKNTVVVKERSLLHKREVRQRQIGGRITDAEGQPLPGVSVKVKGTTVGTVSDDEGRYALSVSDNGGVLVFSYIGFTAQEIPIGGNATINVSLSAEASSLNEVVVVGYGTQSKRNLTSSISSVSAEQIDNYPVSQIGQALQGKVAGAQIIQNSGSPGSSLMIRIRGAGTVNNSEPLYVVDGNLGVDPRDIDPNHIQSIEVLKSASAAAIYGAQGANGVIMITTKNGTPGTPSLQVNYYTGVQEVHNTLALANGREYAMLYNQALTNADRDPLFKDVEGLGKGTDWQDAIFRTAPIHSAELSVGGGSDQGTYYFSGSFFDQKGTVINSDYNRFTFRVNSEYKITPYISVGENLSASYGVRNAIPEFGSRNPVPNAWHMDPTTPVKNPDGTWGYPKFSDTKNPVAEIMLYNNTTKRPVLNGSTYLNINFLENLVFRSQFNLNMGLSSIHEFTPTYDIFPLQRNLVSSLNRVDQQWMNWDWQNTVTFNKTQGGHDIELLGGVTVLTNREENMSAYGQGLPENANIDPSLRYLNLAKDGNLVGGGAGDYGMLSFLGRINYNYKGTYLFTGNFRVDGSSRFGSNNRFGAFPSFSVGWRISDESFMADIDFIDDLKIRGGWGMLGNQNSLPNYAFANTVTSNLVYVFGGSVQQGQAPTSLGNTDLKWETTKETEVGLDFVGFNNKISVSAGYYDKKTQDMLLRIPLPAYTGIQQAPFVNGGDVRNKGFELMVGYHKPKTNDIAYDLSFNLSRNVNEVTKLSNSQAELFSGSYSRTTVGAPIGEFYGYEMEGIFQTIAEVEEHAFQTPGTSPGDIRYRDVNGDKVIDQDDRTGIGSPWPQFVYGLGGNLQWKQFDVSIALQGVQGNDIIADWKYFTQGSNFYNFDAEMLNAWNGAGSSNTIPRLNVNDPNNNMRASSYFLEDGSYLRLKNVQVGYTFPQLISGHIKKLRVYLSGQNLLTLTKYQGYDPEIGVPSATSLSLGIDNGYYPQPRVIMAGLSFGL